MKHTIVSLLVVALIFMCGSTFAASNPPKVCDDLSWWAQSGATPEPVKDARYSGFWWRPTKPASNVNDEELWGNRGVVYALPYEPGAEPAPPPTPTPAPPMPIPPPKVTRQVPVFNHVLFDFDRAVLKPEGKAETGNVAGWVKTYPQDTVVIEGHTCSVGTDEYNLALGQRRSDAVKKYMVQSGVAESRITTVSYGESQPAVPNDTPANRNLNRRAIFKITVGD